MHNKASNIVKTQKYDRYQQRLAAMVNNYFDKKCSNGRVKNEKITNKELAVELHKPIIKKFKKKKYNHLLYKMFGVLILMICN